jgi:hypothetical protein
VSTRLPEKPRAKAIRANDPQAGETRPRRPRKTSAVEAIDWLALWALSIGFNAIVLAALVFYGGHDSTGASMILSGAAVIIALVLGVGGAPAGRG